MVTRAPKIAAGHIQWDPLNSPKRGTDEFEKKFLANLGKFDAVCWAQGINHNDSIYDFDADKNRQMYDANVLFVISSLNTLLRHDLLKRPARLCVISSIWQNIARQNKLSYCVTKAALQGLVSSAAADLARDGHVINAILPGVIDTPMTRTNLRHEQVESIEEATLFGRLPTLDEVASSVYGLCLPGITAVTGQCIAVDLGFSRVRII